MPRRAIALLNLCVAATLFVGYLTAAHSRAPKVLSDPGWAAINRSFPSPHWDQHGTPSDAVPRPTEAFPATSPDSEPDRLHPTASRTHVGQGQFPAGFPASAFVPPVFDRPASLVIPAIALRAPVVPVDLAPDGSLALTDDSTIVFWYLASGYPGEVGRMLFAGHLDSRTGEPGVFAHLSRLRPGDEIIVATERGTLYLYRVTSQQRMEPSHLASVVATPPLRAELVLITCDGWWDARKQQYSHNLLVFATLESVFSE